MPVNVATKKPRTVTQTPDWNDDAVDQALCSVADNYDRMHRKMFELRRKRDLANEKYRLLDEVVYPLTRSGNKHIAVGVRPLEEYEPTLRIGDVKLTMAAIFNFDETREMLQKLTDIMEQLESRPDGEAEEAAERFLGRLSKYSLYKCKFGNICFRSHDPLDVYGSIFISPTTVKMLIGLRGHITDLMSERLVKYAVYPNLNSLVNDVALKIKDAEDRSSINLVDLVFELLDKQHERQPILYEFFLKLPTTFKYQVDEKLDYWAERNDFETL